jgi:hypothetical protein
MGTKRGGDLRVGTPDVKPDASAHTRGVKQGNLGGKNGATHDGDRRSTGIDPKRHQPIDPRMPKITPA